MLWESLGGMFPRKVLGSGVGFRCWGHPQVQQMKPHHPHLAQTQVLISAQHSWQSCWYPLHASPPKLDFILLLCLFWGGGEKPAGTKVRGALFPSPCGPLWCLATLLPALSFASGKCLSPYHHPDRNLTSPCREEWKNLSMENLRSSLAALSGEQSFKWMVSPTQRVTKADQSQRTAHSLVLEDSEILSAALPRYSQRHTGFSLALKATDTCDSQHFPQGKENIQRIEVFLILTHLFWPLALLGAIPKVKRFMRHKYTHVWVPNLVYFSRSSMFISGQPSKAQNENHMSNPG